VGGLRSLPRAVLGRIGIGEYIELLTAATLPRLLYSVHIVIEENGETSAAAALPRFLCWSASLLVRILKFQRPPVFPTSCAPLSSH
jgi:hypothetical protein